MTREEILEKLRDDNEYYSEFGQQFLSNSDIGTLLTEPDKFRKQERTMTVPFKIGQYFHNLLLEPDKVHKYKVIQSSTRNTKVYKELSEGEVCLLQSEVDMMEAMKDKIYSIPQFDALINQGNVEYEVPAIKQINDVWFKGKADILNHDEKLIIDLKTTSNIDNFAYSAKKYGYTSQAYIYQDLFGYEMVFIVIEKNTHRCGIYTCSDKFLQTGMERVDHATMVYKEWLEHPEVFDKHFIEQVL